MGELEYQGTITAPVQFDYFPIEVRNNEQDTLAVAESICPDMEPWQLIRELSLIYIESEVLYRPFRTLSSGEQIKVLLATLFLKQNHFLLIDEPTNHLDGEGRQIVKAYLAKKRGYILVSHDRAFLDGCIDHVLSINKMDIQVVRGNFSSWWQNKQNRDNMEREQDQKLKKEIERLNVTARRTAEWSTKLEATKFGGSNNKSGLRPDRGAIGAQAARMMKRAKVTEHRAQSAAQQKSALLKNVESQQTLKIHPLRYHSDPLLSLRDVALFYGEKQICANTHFQINRGDRLALCGKNGSGKSTIFKLLTGQEIRYTGSYSRASGLKISYVPQDTAHLTGGLTEYARQLGIDETLFNTILRKMDFSRTQLKKDMRDFSSGQKKKVMLAGSLSQQAHLYIWDEALNFVDVLSRIQIEELILAYCPTMLFVEHDKAFCDHIATKMIEL
jgi:lincosamide and streptogramin A transport system ATP-binding/permease protein